MRSLNPFLSYSCDLRSEVNAATWIITGQRSLHQIWYIGYCLTWVLRCQNNAHAEKSYRSCVSANQSASPPAGINGCRPFVVVVILQ